MPVLRRISRRVPPGRTENPAEEVLAVLCLGPLALPLVWLNPRYKPAIKAVITIIVLGVTILCLFLTVLAYQRILNQFTALGV